MNTNPDDRSTNFDDLLLELQQEPQPEQPKPTTLEPYDKDAYKERKQAERDEAYRLADITAEKAAASGEEYAKYLNVQARYNRYSVNNALLIAAQMPDATKLATFEEWQENKIQIRAGAKAITLLKSAGYKFGEDGKLSAETPIQLEYLTNTTSGHIAIAESIQQDLAAVGIELSIQQQDWNVFLEERKAGNFDFAREGWIADFNDPINMLEMWTTVSGNNDCQFGR